MKIRIFLTLALLAFVFTGCDNKSGDNGENTTDNTENTTPDKSGTFKVDPAMSKIVWTGAKTEQPGEHHGEVAIKEGSLTLDKDGHISGGTFSVDMLSIITTDSMPEDKMNGLVGHLKSAEFFDVENFAMATYTITSAQMDEATAKTNITGDLKVKDLGKEISFPATVGMVGDNELNATGQVVLSQEDMGLQTFPAKITLDVTVVAKK